jgi:hypothetical protein
MRGGTRPVRPAPAPGPLLSSSSLAVIGLGQVGEHTARRGLHGIGDGAVRGEQDHRQRRVARADLVKQRQAVACRAGARRSAPAAAGQCPAGPARPRPSPRRSRGSRPPSGAWTAGAACRRRRPPQHAGRAGPGVIRGRQEGMACGDQGLVAARAAGAAAGRKAMHAAGVWTGCARWRARPSSRSLSWSMRRCASRSCWPWRSSCSSAAAGASLRGQQARQGVQAARSASLSRCAAAGPARAAVSAGCRVRVSSHGQPAAGGRAWCRRAHREAGHLARQGGALASARVGGPACQRQQAAGMLGSSSSGRVGSGGVATARSGLPLPWRAVAPR